MLRPSRNERHHDQRNLAREIAHDLDRKFDVVLDPLDVGIIAEHLDLAPLIAERDVLIQLNASAGVSAALDIQERNELIQLRQQVQQLREALQTIADKRVLVMDDLNEDVGDAMVKVAKAALAAKQDGQG